jgi:NAD(P)-dependent dehydrogenase (short-subunit alcohol dehydrogenase family)
VHREAREVQRDVTRTDDSPVPDYPGLLRLDGRRFVVLGAGQGIGRQASHALTSVGARVACVDQDAELAGDIAAEVSGVPLSGNAYDRDDMASLFSDAARVLGGIDGVVDIIGMARYADLTDLSDEDWDWHFDIVLRHAFLAMQYGGRAMQANGGAMVFVASVSGITSAPRHSAYGAAKAGLMSLVRTGAVELGPAGIRVNAVAPGVVWTPRVSEFLGEEGRRRNIANTPLRRVAQPADIAAALLFLASDLAAYVTGQTLTVDGGVGAKFPYPMADL